MINPKITGWANFFKASCAYKSFSKVDNHVFILAYKWAKRRHNNKSAEWIKEKYFPKRGTRNWSFNTTFLDKEYVLNKMEDVKISRHVKVRNSANVYDKTHKMYFFKRKNKEVVKPRKSSC